MRNYEKKHRRFKNPQAGWQLRRKGGFGLNEVIGIAAGIIIAAVVVSAYSVLPAISGKSNQLVEQYGQYLSTR